MDWRVVERGNDPYLPADLVFFRGSEFISCAVRIFTRSWGESRSEVNHVGIIAPDGELIESLHTTIKRPFISDEAFAVFRLEGITDDQRLAIAQTAMSYVGRRYGYAKILAHLGDWILGDRFVFRRLCRMDRYPICSWVAAWSYFKVIGYEFGTAPKAASPDSMWDNIAIAINRCLQ